MSVINPANLACYVVLTPLPLTGLSKHKAKCNGIKSKENNTSIGDKLLMDARVILQRLKIFTCDQCMRSFHRERDFKLHKLTHKEIMLVSSSGTTPYECFCCEVYSLTKTAVLMMSSVQRHEKPTKDVKNNSNGCRKSGDMHLHKMLVHIRDKSSEIKSEAKKEPDSITESKLNKCITKRKKYESAQENKCELCEKTYKNRRKLQNHMSLRHRGTYNCNICKKVFNVKGYLVIHMRTHTGERPYTCDVCGKTFTQWGSWNMHMKRHTGIKDFKCQYCKKQFLNNHSKILHERTHTKEKPYKCLYCAKDFCDPSAFARHVRIHTGVKPYCCPYCPKKYSDNSSLYRHKRYHEDFKPEKCKQCNKRFITKTILRCHVTGAHGIRKHKCRICDKSFTMKGTLKQHEICAHKLTDRIYDCNYCKKRFYYRQILINHIERFHMLHIYCNICYHRFCRDSDYREHKRKGCTKQYACDICNKVFTQGGRLKYHMSSIHGKDKYECDYCGRVSKVKMNLIQHIKKCHLKVDKKVSILD